MLVSSITGTQFCQSRRSQETCFVSFVDYRKPVLLRRLQETSFVSFVSTVSFRQFRFFSSIAESQPSVGALLGRELLSQLLWIGGQIEAIELVNDYFTMGCVVSLDPFSPRNISIRSQDTFFIKAAQYTIILQACFLCVDQLVSVKFPDSKQK